MNEQLTLEFEKPMYQLKQEGTFYNTPNLKGSDLKKAKQKANNQYQIVLNFFKMNPDALFTPCEVHAKVLRFAPITSCRRAITNLTIDGLLEKTNVQKYGQYEVLTYCWRLKK